MNGIALELWLKDPRKNVNNIKFAILLILLRLLRAQKAKSKAAREDLESAMPGERPEEERGRRKKPKPKAKESRKEDTEQVDEDEASLKDDDQIDTTGRKSGKARKSGDRESNILDEIATRKNLGKNLQVSNIKRERKKRHRMRIMKRN